MRRPTFVSRHLGFAAVLCLIVLLPALALATKQVSGYITTAAVWDTVGGRIYEVTGNVIVQPGAELTINPGVVVKFNSYAGLHIHGGLMAVGGSGYDSTVYFTSIKDDNIPPPLGNDTNGDGNATVPAKEDWTYIYFYDDSADSSLLEHCDLWFGGYNDCGLIYCADAGPHIRDCVVNASYYGLQCTGAASPTIENTDISACTSVPLAITMDADPVFDAVTFGSTSDNGYDAIGLLGTTLSSNATLRVRGTQIGGNPIPNITYLLLNDITVNAPAVLAIAPGIVIKCLSYSTDLIVNGALVADGKSDSLIVFTSVKDDNYGDPNDTNNDGSSTAPAAGNWGRIMFGAGSSGTLDCCVVKYGGYGGRSLVRAYNVGSGISITNSHLSDADYGIEIVGTSNPVVSGNTIANCTYTPVLMSVSADPTFSGNTFSGNGITALGLINETVGVNSHLRRRDIAGFANITYYVTGDLTMGVGAVLTVDPGVVVKLKRQEPYAYDTDIIIKGGLSAQGKPDSVIVFTSERDDTYGNPPDTNGDGPATLPTWDWGRIELSATAIDSACILRHCLIGHGYGKHVNPYPKGALACLSASPTIDNCTFNGNYVGLRCEGNSEPLVTNSHFSNSYNVPIIVSVTADPTLTNNTFEANAYHAVGIVSETLSQNGTLDVSTVGPPQFSEPFPYLVYEGDLTVGTGVTMTILPGVVVKFSGYNTGSIIVNGGLVAEGTSDSAIVFSSIRDDSHGGDSNVDGSATSPANGDWNNIQFTASSDDAQCRLDNCLFWYGGHTTGAVYIESASPSIADCSFEFNNIALWIKGLSNPVITGNLLRQSTYEPIAVDPLANPIFSGNSLDGNGLTALGIIGSSLAQNGNIPVRNVGGYSNITYVLDSNLNVLYGATLTVEPGVVIKMFYSSSTNPYATGSTITVQGGLIADGAPSDPIVFTSVRDDEYGNPSDTNGDGVASTPSPGDWYRIEFTATSVDTSCLMDNCAVRYGNFRYSSSMYNHYGSVRVTGSSPAFTNCSFEHAYWYGMRLDGAAAPTIEDCDFIENGCTPIAMTLDSDPVMSGNQFIGNQFTALGIIGGTLAQDMTWARRNVAQIENIPYILLTDLIVGTGATLTLEPGLVVKFWRDYCDRTSGYPYYTVQLIVNRSLLAEGKADPESLIVFTSATDDFYGGDTNGDSTKTDGNSETWGWVEIASTAMSSGVRFKNCVFSHTYDSQSYGAVVIKGGVSPTFENCLFSHNSVGINYTEASGDSTKGRVDSSDFFDNHSYAIKNTGMAHTVSAENCWWGHATGPYDSSDDTGSGGLYNPAGLGDQVTDMVYYSPWGTEGVENYLLGDVSLNGRIYAYDASLILRWVVSDTTLSPRQQVIGDVTCNAGLTALDASYILQYVAGKITFFPCEIESTPTFLLACNWPGLAPGEFGLKIDDFGIEHGGEVTIPLSVSGSGEVYAANFEIAASSDKVCILGAEPAPGHDDVVLYSTVADDGTVRIALAGSCAIGMGPVAMLKLHVDEDVSEEEEVLVSFSKAMLNEQDVLEKALPGRGLHSRRLPATFALLQNVPNPFNPGTNIRYAIPDTGSGPVLTRLKVYSATGELVRVLLDEPRSAGVHGIYWDGKDDAGREVTSGVYFYRLEASDFSAVKKMIFLK